MTRIFLFIHSQTFLVVAGAVVLAILVGLEFYTSYRVRKFIHPAYKLALRQAGEDAERIIAEARREARTLVEKAETQSVELVGTHTTLDEAAERDYQKALQTMLERLETRLEQDVSAARDAQARLSEEFAATLKATGEAARGRLEQSFDVLLKENAARINEHIAQVFATAKTDAESYARARRDVIDTHIVDLVGETMKIVLQKNLTADVHERLIQAALEEAKANHVF